MSNTEEPKSFEEQLNEAQTKKFLEDMNTKSEGDEKLKQLLLECHNKGIEVLYCSRGHSADEPPYIVMSIEPNKSSFNSIKKICADLSNMPNVLLTFSDRLNFRGNDLTISCTMSNKEEVFSASIKSLQNTEKELQGSEKEEDFPESINTLYNTVKNYVCDRNFSGTHTTKGVFFSIGGRDREKSKRFVEELKTNYTSLHKDLYNSSPKFLKHMGLYALGQYVNGLTKEQLASHAQKILKRNINNDKGAR